MVSNGLICLELVGSSIEFCVSPTAFVDVSANGSSGLEDIFSKMEIRTAFLLDISPGTIFDTGTIRSRAAYLWLFSLLSSM